MSSAAASAGRRARRHGSVHFLYETNVGAGLPVIQTVRDLVQTGDEIESVEGVFSGTLAYLFNLHLLSDGLVFKVVLVLTSMPVAFNALVAASIFDLDLDMANSCWLVTTLGLIIVLPWLYFLLSSSLLPL